MGKFKNDIFTVLNYQGSKKTLLEFIYNNTINYVDENKAFLDIFCGTCSVGYSMKRNNTIYANDSELYASVIASALLNFNKEKSWESLEPIFAYYYRHNYEKLTSIFEGFLIKEKRALDENNFEMLNDLYKQFPTIWSGKQFDYYENKIESINDLRKYKNEIPYMLFSTYYSNTYFGLMQAIEIDSIRYSIDKIDNENIQNMLLCSLYFAMKECVFSKDGHMAQPLDIMLNSSKLMKTRAKSIFKAFLSKVKEFYSEDFVTNDKANKVFNMPMEKLLTVDKIKENVGFIYADPPYTDMQYSRYYHLLNTVTLYDYDDISLYRGGISKGLYRSKRFQSPLSQRGQSQKYTEMLFRFCKENKINLGFSFAYPRNPEEQPVNRYTMSIETIIGMAESTFNKKNVEVITEEYEHSNNRNSDTKKVLEYLIVCKL